MASKNHIHRYKYVNIGKKDKSLNVYACSLPNCSHYMPVNHEKLLIGKETLCNQCMEKTIMTADIVGRHIVKPRCYSCRTGSKITEPEKKEEAVQLDGALDMLLKMRL